MTDSEGSAPPQLLAFCEREYPRLVGVLGLYCGNRAVAEELAQETLARVWLHWSKAEIDDPRAWAHRAAINLANSYFRRLAAERRARQRMQGAARETEFERDLAAASAVRNAVARLPRRQRTALVLRYYLDLPFSEIARIMDAPESTVKSLVRRALARLRKHENLADLEEVLNVT